MSKSTNSKRSPAKRLPDTRLRLERRPAWTRQGVSLPLELGNGAELLQVMDTLVDKIMSLSALDDHPIDPTGQRRCRVCHCTDVNCEGCIRLTGQVCEWSVEDPTVCTACLKPKELSR